MAWRIRYRPDSRASADDESRHVGEVELTPRPMATPKLTKMKDSAAAANAPAITELQRIFQRSSAAGTPPAMTSSCTSASMVIASPSAQAEERQDRHDHHDQADEINQSVHGPILQKCP